MGVVLSSLGIAGICAAVALAAGAALGLLLILRGRGQASWELLSLGAAGHHPS